MAQSQQNRDRSQTRILPAVLLGSGSLYALSFTGPVLHGAVINGYALIACCFLIVAGAAFLSDGLWYLGNVLDRKSAQIPTGQKGTSDWVQSREEIAHDLIANDWGPYWGTFKGKEIIADIGSNSVIIGTTGSGKGVGMVQPNILTIRGSKIIPDFKGENAAIMARVLRERGENVFCLNIGEVFTDILGETAYYNPLCLIADNYNRPGGLQDITDDVHEICKQLDPEPVGSDDENGNKYFRNGSRGLIGFAIQMCILVDGYNATLGDVAAMLNDKQSLLRHAKWACGRLEQV
ncbi:MAG: type IV secretory system conjugative DNA transfer family protein [Cohaesibacteraceae bacterium]|nr:type IV secretory system conjugative DNA transfer family protein [Cohaesibacteraceae bacterium]